MDSLKGRSLNPRFIRPNEIKELQAKMENKFEETDQSILDVMKHGALLIVNALNYPAKKFWKVPESICEIWTTTLEYAASGGLFGGAVGSGGLCGGAWKECGLCGGASRSGLCGGTSGCLKKIKMATL